MVVHDHGYCYMLATSGMMWLPPVKQCGIHNDAQQWLMMGEELQDKERYSTNMYQLLPYHHLLYLLVPPSAALSLTYGSTHLASASLTSHDSERRQDGGNDPSAEALQVRCRWHPRGGSTLLWGTKLMPSCGAENFQRSVQTQQVLKLARMTDTRPTPKQILKNSTLTCMLER